MKETCMNPGDITSEADIKHLVDTFYDRIFVDPVIGFIFTDTVMLSRETHLPIMYAFWSSMLLGTHSYAGNPMAKHIDLDKKFPLSEEHFSRWFMLWEETVRSLFHGTTAEVAIARAKHIAGVMRQNIVHSRSSRP